MGPSIGQKLKTQPNVLQTGPQQFNIVGRSVSLENPAPNTGINTPFQIPLQTGGHRIKSILLTQKQFVKSVTNGLRE